ncbi:hypothetical protein ACFX13_005519 [Malus domestica]|uniref:Phosphoglycerate mutase family protein n=1 Tax=Malus domestica TaxID=3750 RepID=A0A498IWD6_MALDO|nr:uncharacterized protein At3g52155, chloroplastic [Malus domestica]XP_028943569.1 uncharacterized protein At3g52155, chloroplastic [Malus domestica]RXH85743.1 hypothetical protein DVH24_014327 [Malus domestica]
MNAVTLFNHSINLNIQQHSFSFPPAANPKWPRASSSSIRRRNASSGTRPSSSPLVVEVESKAVSDSEQTPPPSVARRLILLRHANSSWVDPSLKDHDRPLSERGQADAVKVSLKLQQLGWIPQLILSSNAVRTRETLTIMQQQVRGFLEAEVHYISSFYSIAAMDGQTAEHLQHIICNYSRDDILTVMCMGHNRGWEEAASMFTGASIELKTCNAALLETTGKSWDEAFTLAGLGGWKLQGIVKPVRL